MASRSLLSGCAIDLTLPVDGPQDRLPPNQHSRVRTSRPAKSPKKGAPRKRSVHNLTHRDSKAALPNQGNALQAAPPPQSSPCSTRRAPTASVCHAGSTDGRPNNRPERRVAASAAVVPELHRFSQREPRLRAVGRLSRWAVHMADSLPVVSVTGEIVLSYMVERRRREIGIPTALGAGRVQVIAIVWRRAAALVTVGLIICSAGAFGVGRLLTRLMTGAPAGVPAVVAGACCVLAIAGSLAAFVPAARAASVDPIEALRSE